MNKDSERHQARGIIIIKKSKWSRDKMHKIKNNYSFFFVSYYKYILSIVIVCTKRTRITLWARTFNDELNRKCVRVLWCVNLTFLFSFFSFHCFHRLNVEYAVLISISLQIFVFVYIKYKSSVRFFFRLTYIAFICIHQHTCSTQHTYRAHWIYLK